MPGDKKTCISTLGRCVKPIIKQDMLKAGLPCSDYGNSLHAPVVSKLEMPEDSQVVSSEPHTDYDRSASVCANHRQHEHVIRICLLASLYIDSAVDMLTKPKVGSPKHSFLSLLEVVHAMTMPDVNAEVHVNFPVVTSTVSQAPPHVQHAMHIVTDRLAHPLQLRFTLHFKLAAEWKHTQQ